MVEELIIQATAVTNVPPPWERKIRGQLQLYSGQLEAAVETLSACVSDDPDDVGALALLSLAYLDFGDHKGYLTSRERLAAVKARKPVGAISPEDQLLVAEAEMFGDISAGVATIKSVIDKAPTPLALAFLCEAHMKLYYGSGDTKTRDEAMAELHAVKQFMPDSAYVLRLDFWLNFILLTQGDDSPERTRSRETSPLIEWRLCRTTLLPAMHVRAIFSSLANLTMHERNGIRLRMRPVPWSGCRPTMPPSNTGTGTARKPWTSSLARHRNPCGRSITGEEEILALDGRENQARVVYEGVAKNLRTFVFILMTLSAFRKACCCCSANKRRHLAELHHAGALLGPCLAQRYPRFPR